MGKVSNFSKGMEKISKNNLMFNGKYPIIHYADLYKFAPIQKKVFHYTNHITSSPIPKNSLLFPGSDVTPDGLARTSTMDKENIYAGGDIIIANLSSTDIKSKFLTFEINYRKDRIIPLITGTTIRHLHAKELQSLPINYPDLSEQNKIGQLLSKLDDTITLLQQREEKLYSFKRRLNQHFFREAYMKNFSKRSISSLGDIYSGLSGKNKSDFDHGKGHYITYININRNLISDIDGINTIEIDNKQNLVRKGDILFTLSSETPDEVGLASVWLYDLSNTYLNSFSFGFRPNNQILDSLYLGYFFRSDYFRKKSFPLAQGISRYNLSKKSFLNLTIPIPTLKIQQKIAHTLYTVDNLISKNKNITSTLYKLKQFLLQNMFI